MLEYKSIPFEIKDLDTKQGIVNAYYASFGTWDDGGDLIEAGAFKKTIKERGPSSKQCRIKKLFNHDSDMLIGQPMLMEEDEKGLRCETKIVPTSLGSDILKLYEAGVITEHSIGYDSVQVKYDETHPTVWGPGRILKEIRLWDISAVTWGMNKDTPTLGLKTLGDPTLARIHSQLASMETILRKGTLSHDELYTEIDRAAKSLRDAIEALRNQDEPDGTGRTTPDDDEPLAAAYAAALKNIRDTRIIIGGGSNA